MISSKDLESFLNNLNNSKEEYNIAKDCVATEEKRTQDILHAIEFEQSARERNKLCTKLRKARVERRRNKDIVEQYEPVMKFLEVQANTTTINNMKRLLGDMRKVEKYHDNRTYYPRLKDDE